MAQLKSKRLNFGSRFQSKLIKDVSQQKIDWFKEKERMELGSS